MKNWINLLFLNCSKVPFFSFSPLLSSFLSWFSIISFSWSMLETIFPPSCILVSVRPCFFSLTFIFSFNKISFITRTISFTHFSNTGKIIEIKISFIKRLSLSKEILAVSMELAILKFTFIDISTEFKLPFSCLFSIYKISFILNSVIVPRFDSFTMIQIV
jgi:hypothetical protein